MKILERKGAKAAGAVRYFTGKPCVRGHIAERYTSTGQCVVCIGEHDKKWSAENPEKRRAIQKKYRQENRDTMRAAFKAWHVKNRSRVLERQKEYRAANPEKLKVIQAAYVAKNLPAVKAKHARRRATQREANHPYSLELMRLVEREAFDLARRREIATGFKWHVDHIVPLQSKIVCGLHNEFNLAVIPATKNLIKGNRVWPDMPKYN